SPASASQASRARQAFWAAPWSGKRHAGANPGGRRRGCACGRWSAGGAGRRTRGGRPARASFAPSPPAGWRAAIWRRAAIRPAATGRQRIDRWLWHARLVRTRSAAAALAAAGYVRVNGARIDAPGRMVRLGDVITVALDHAVRVLKVRGFTERRGPPTGGREL